MIENISLQTYIIIVFLVGWFFSFAHWLESNIENITNDNFKKKLARGVSHSSVGAIIGVSTFVGLHDYFPEVSRIMATLVAIIFAIMVDVVLFVLKKKGSEI